MSISPNVQKKEDSGQGPDGDLNQHGLNLKKDIEG